LADKISNIDGKVIPRKGILKHPGPHVDTILQQPGPHVDALDDKGLKHSKGLVTGVSNVENDVSHESNCTSSADSPNTEVRECLNTTKVIRDTTMDPTGIKTSFAETLIGNTAKTAVNFRSLHAKSLLPGVDVVLSKESVRIIQDRLQYTLYGYFLGDRVAFPVMEYFVKTHWKRFGLQKMMMNSNGFFFFRFADKKGMLDVLEGGPWLVRNKPIFLNVWSPASKLKKEDIQQVAVWVKFHDVPLAAYSDDGLSMMAKKVGKPKLLDTYRDDVS
jgi:hypothetical protein